MTHIELSPLTLK